MELRLKGRFSMGILRILGGISCLKELFFIHIFFVRRKELKDEKLMVWKYSQRRRVT